MNWCGATTGPGGVFVCMYVCMAVFVEPHDLDVAILVILNC